MLKNSNYSIISRNSPFVKSRILFYTEQVIPPYIYIYMTTLSVYDAITLQWHQLQVSAPVKINNVQTNNNLWIRIGKVCRSILRRHMIEEKSSNHEGNRHTCYTKVSLWEQLNTPAHGGNLWVTSLPWSDSRGTSCIQQSHLPLWIYNNNRTHLWQFQRLQSEMVNVCNNYLAVLLN